jgi:23S rRNA pseudouridine1911/1915/1917 synthase
MASEQLIHLEVDQPGLRLDQYLVQNFPDLSRTQLKKLIQQGKVLVSGQPAKPSLPVQPGEQVTLSLPAPESGVLQPEAVPLDLVFEDEDLVVINKPAGMVVHPAHGHTSGTLVNALLARYPELKDMADVDSDTTGRPGIVHRLDQDTSGLIIVARTPEALQGLRRQFKSRQVDKIYLALVFGQPEAPEGIIEVPLGRDPRHRQRMAPLAEGKSARTRYRVLEAYNGFSLLEIGLETGRTHQIRVHLAWLKCPVVGDTIYGRKKNPLGLKRQFLHAWQLRFPHPRTGEELHLEAPLAADLQAVVDQLRGSIQPV